MHSDIQVVYIYIIFNLSFSFLSHIVTSHKYSSIIPSDFSFEILLYFGNVDSSSLFFLSYFLFFLNLMYDNFYDPVI